MPDPLEHLKLALADRYKVERELGRGGMATVYLAEDLKHHRRVAIKVLRPELASALGPERFLREITLTAQLDHPHILPLYDSGSLTPVPPLRDAERGPGGEDLLFYVMPYVEGESLRGLLDRERQLPVEDALLIAREVADALSYAHSRGIVHRDIKPENILLSGGHARVADFGIARAVSAAGGEALTQTGVVIGTPQYMSPEQATGDSDIDGRTDLYALGCVLYEMLAGQPPFTGPSMESVIHQHVMATPPPVTQFRPAVPPDVASALQRALAKMPADRFNPVAQFSDALRSGTSLRPGSAAATESGERTIAVLPFVTMPADPENDYFSDGITEEIINALVQVPGLQVSSRTSSFAFKGKNVPMAEVADRLQVTTVLEGSVRKAGNRLRITAQLVDVRSDKHLWSERFDRQLEDVFAIQDEIATNIATSLRGMLTEGEKRAIERSPTENMQAYECYLRGRQFMHQFRRSGFEHARRMFERAIAIDPKYGPAFAGAADCCSYLYTHWDRSQANLDQADALSQRALEVAPERAEAHASRGLVLSLVRRLDEAAGEFETAIRLNPKLYEAHYFYGRACFAEGKFEDAVRHYAEAARVRPDDYQALSHMAMSLTSLGRKDEAAAAKRQSLERVEKHIELNPDDARALYFGANAVSAAGDRARALEWNRRALAIDPEDPGVLYNVACVFALLGQKEDAIDTISKSVANGMHHWEWLEQDSDLDSLRGDPRFDALITGLKEASSDSAAERHG